MAKARRPLAPTQLDPVAQQILGSLRDDFLAKNLSAHDLKDGYVGVALPALVQHHCDAGATSQVDFDLALKQLEASKLVDTGPKAPYENRPNSQVAIFAIISKREYVYLTEEGYRAAQHSKSTSSKTPRPTVHISGGTFHQSPIGIGDNVTQSVTVSSNELAEGVRRLVNQLEQMLPTSGLPVSVQAGSQSVIAELREAAAASTPDVGRLRRGLESLKHVMEHATGHLVATGVLTMIGELLSRAAH